MDAIILVAWSPFLSDLAFPTIYLSISRDPGALFFLGGQVQTDVTTLFLKENEVPPRDEFRLIIVNCLLVQLGDRVA